MGATPPVPALASPGGVPPAAGTPPVPVAPPGWEPGFADVAHECVAVTTPDRFMAVGQVYDDFDQTTDDRVLACLVATDGPQQ